MEYVVFAPTFVCDAAGSHDMLLPRLERLDRVLAFGLCFVARGKRHGGGTCVRLWSQVGSNIHRRGLPQELATSSRLRLNSEKGGSSSKYDRLA